jgi:hypothetical protein
MKSESRRADVANPLQDRYAEMLLERVTGARCPSATYMDMLESVASDRVLVAYIINLMERIEDDPHPSIAMMHRVRRLIARFGN